MQGIAFSSLGKTAEAIGRFQDGIARIEPLIEANPDVYDFRDIRGQLYFNLGRNLPSMEESRLALEIARGIQKKLCEFDPLSEDYRLQLQETEDAIEKRKPNVRCSQLLGEC